MLLDIESHPAWVCGLKLQYHKTSLSTGVSHPAWVCGLKPCYWQIAIPGNSHTLRGCVD